MLSLALSPDFANDGLLYAGTEAYGLFRSQDRGTSWVRLAEQTLNGAVNSILLSPQFPNRPDVLVLHEDVLLVSRDGGDTWMPWPADPPIEGAVASVAAPQGLGSGAPLLVGLMDGTVLWI
jgi:photosystem II stability/assembly factor-like uncharacterized protein